MKNYILLLPGLILVLQVAGQCSFSVSAVTTPVSCYNFTDGAITVNVTGGTAPYQYQLAEAGAGAWQAGNSFSALAAGTYPVSVHDATGCIKTIYVTVTQPAQLVASYTVHDASCFGSNDGSIQISTTGGSAPYSYDWKKDGVDFSVTKDISGLSPANYLLVVTDASGCVVSPDITPQVKEISLTGFNQDVIVNGSGAASGTVSTTMGGYAFYENGFLVSGSPWGTGFPVSGNFQSYNDAARGYQLASYSASNSLILTKLADAGSVTSGSLGFTAPYQSPYGLLYILGTTTNGTGTVDYTVHYTDASTSTGSITFPDWYQTSPTAMTALAGMGRITLPAGTFDVGLGNSFSLYETTISIPVPSLGKVVSSVSFVWSNLSTATARVHLFGITGYTSTAAGIRVNDGAAVTVTPAVSVTNDVNSNTFCSGQSVNFTATPVNGGNTPTYQWKKNGSDITGATAATYTTTDLINNDQISVILTSSLSCLSSSTGTSPLVTMTEGTLPASVTVATASSSICSGSSTTFTATAVNGGDTPGYQWKLNGTDIPGETGSSFASSGLVNGDQVSVRMTSSIGCASGSPANGNTVTMTVTPSAEPTVSISSVPNVTFSSSVTYEGNAPSYQWYKNGEAIAGATSSTYFTASAGLGNVYSLKLTSNYACRTAPAAMSNYITVSYSVLPVKWEQFTVKQQQAVVMLQWKVSDAGDIDYFTVYRSSASGLFSVIGQVTADGTANYRFTDKDPGNGLLQYYIEATDFSGRKYISGTRSLNRRDTGLWEIADNNGYWVLSTKARLQYYLLDSRGCIIRTGEAEGSEVISIQKPVAAGIYFLQVKTAENRTAIKLLH